ncbi:MAG: SCO family protein [Pirellula sp.]|nr:SCO family protein [Pirellula sp.]
MNRIWFRVLGVGLGVVLGTGAAISTKILRNSGKDPVPSPQLADSEDDPWENPRPATPPDPGKRKLLAELTQSAEAEEKWLKEFTFTDQIGQEVSTKSLLGQPYVACFFFTTCTGTCPRQTSQMQLLAKKYKDKPIRFLNITVDPEIDTQEVLKEYSERYGANPEKWPFVRGEMAYTQKVGIEKFFLDGVEKRGHPDRFCLVNSDGVIVGSYYWPDIDERALLESHIAELLK